MDPLTKSNLEVAKDYIFLIFEKLLFYSAALIYIITQVNQSKHVKGMSLLYIYIHAKPHSIYLSYFNTTMNHRKNLMTLSYHCIMPFSQFYASYLFMYEPNHVPRPLGEISSWFRVTALASES